MSEVHTYIETLKKIGINGIQIIQDGQEIGCFMKKEYKRQNQYSITKSFTSAAVGFAIEEGLFELNSKVCQLFDEAIKKHMTVASLFWPVTAQSKVTYNVTEVLANKTAEKNIQL